MAKKQVTIFTDDITGAESDDVATRQFSLNGVSYEIDLNEANADRLSTALEPYIAAGRRTGSNRARSGGRARSEASKVRAWAIETGLDVPSRGRIPASVTQAYTEAIGAK